MNCLPAAAALLEVGDDMGDISGDVPSLSGDLLNEHLRCKLRLIILSPKTGLDECKSVCK